ncbi:hypothetical protein V6N13_129673 [Hibiscus sabdariffa]
MMARVALGVDEWLGVKRNDLRGLFKCSMEECIYGSSSRGVSKIGFATQFNGYCHGDVRWWVRWFNGGCRMKVVKWNDGFVMKMKEIRDDDF